MKVIKGDLFDLVTNGYFNVIVHGCNCFNTMGAGIAKTIKEFFLEAYLVDQRTVKGDPNKLGTYTRAHITRGEVEFDVVNAYTQYRYGRGIQVDYNAIRSVFLKLKDDYHGLRIGYPKIGAGLAGGDWNIIQNIIDECLEGENHTLVIL